MLEACFVPVLPRYNQRRRGVDRCPQYPRHV
ncbi:unnamed protein product [Victoria cruziana]